MGWVRLRIAGSTLLLALPWAAGGCGSANDPVVLPPPETFRWAEQPIAFSPAPEGWRREGYGQGGLKGVLFIKTGSVGEGITVAVHHLVSDRDRTAELRDLLKRYDSMSTFEREKAMRLAPMRTESPYSPLEAQVAADVNEEIWSAQTAQRNGDDFSAKFRLESALRRSENLRLSLGDVIESVVFRPENRADPDSFQAVVRRDTTIAGHEAALTDYRFHGPERVYRAREYWLMESNHLFTAQYIGLEENLAVFDSVVASITFPPRSPEPIP
jgi:hypothetical protein